MTRVPYSMDTDELMEVTQTTLNKRMNLLAKIQHVFWQRWTQEYLPASREKHNSRGTMENYIKEGYIVLVHEDNRPRAQRNLSKVQSLAYGKDGLIRSSNIKTTRGVTNRPITKLYPLEVCADTSGNAEPETVNTSTDVPSTRTPR